MKTNSKKLLTALFLLMTPWLMGLTLIFLLPTTYGWMALFQVATVMMACGTSAAGGMVGWYFLSREVENMQKWEKLGALEATQ